MGAVNPTDLPLWQCHKVVHAAQITAIGYSNNRERALLVFDGVQRVEVAEAWMIKHSPRVGGYYVLYDDGYDSFSPRAAFEAGYTRMTEPPPPTEGVSNGN